LLRADASAVELLGASCIGFILPASRTVCVEVQGPVADNASYDSLGAFVQATVPLLGGRPDAVPGARCSYCRADAESTDSG
jgi:hypothetical protein